MSNVAQRVQHLIALSASSFDEEGRTAAHTAAKLMLQHNLTVVPQGQQANGDLSRLQDTVRQQDNNIRILRSELQEATGEKYHAYRKATEAQQLARQQSMVIGSLRDEIAEIAEAARIAKEQAAEIEALRQALVEARRQMAEINHHTTTGAVKTETKAKPVKKTPAPTAAKPIAATPQPQVVAPPKKTTVTVDGTTIPSFDIPMPWRAPPVKENVLSISLDWTPPTTNSAAPSEPVVNIPLQTPVSVGKVEARQPIVEPSAPSLTSAPKATTLKAPPPVTASVAHLADLAADLLFST